jgi:hypothetical protein
MPQSRCVSGLEFLGFWNICIYIMSGMESKPKCEIHCGFIGILSIWPEGHFMTVLRVLCFDCDLPHEVRLSLSICGGMSVSSILDWGAFQIGIFGLGLLRLN